MWRLVPLMLLVGVTCAAQPVAISGIINSYAAVVELESCGRWLRVDDAGSLRRFDRVLLIQMKGAVLDTVESPRAGDVDTLGLAGHHELATVARVAGDTVHLFEPIQREYDPRGRVQLVGVPRYEDATVVGPVHARQWNGTTGGVVAVEVLGTLRLDADIDVDSAGFAGGWQWYPMHVHKCDVMGYTMPVDSGWGGEKGEGIGELDAVRLGGGRGRQANGGGGGNSTNAGGGGGGNGGRGGIGGFQWDGVGCTEQLATGGLGGLPTMAAGDSLRALMGGGGGSGHGNDWLESAGARGGGLVIVRATRLDGNGRTIGARGGTADTSDNDGAGGGGAGGTIVLDIDTLVSALSIDARGGDGGGTKGVVGCHGPGGGGGGGALLLSTPYVPAQLSATLDGGEPGAVLASSLVCFGTSYGAAPGEPGIIRTGVGLIDPHTYPVLALPTVVAVAGEIVELPVTIQRRSDFAFRPLERVRFTVSTPRELLHQRGSVVDVSLATSGGHQLATVERLLGARDDTLAVLRGTALLGPIGSAPVTFAAVEYGPPSAAYACPVTYDVINGQLAVLTCEEGGERRVNVTTATLIRSIAPNPATDAVTLTYALADDAPVSIELYDAGGNRTTLFSGAPGAGEHTATYSLRAQPAGHYTVRLVTPYESIDRPVLLIR